jgi:hypothetical protein
MLKNILTLLDWIGKKIAYKRRMENKVDEALILLKEHEKKLIRLEMLEAMRRDDRAVVHQLWDTYKALGGNSYMKELYKNYCQGKK